MVSERKKGTSTAAAKRSRKLSRVALIEQSIQVEAVARRQKGRRAVRRRGGRRR